MSQASRIILCSRFNLYTLRACSVFIACDRLQHREYVHRRFGRLYLRLLKPKHDTKVFLTILATTKDNHGIHSTRGCKKMFKSSMDSSISWKVFSNSAILSATFILLAKPTTLVIPSSDQKHPRSQAHRGLLSISSTTSSISN